MKVFVCSHVDPYYSSFYIYGLEKLFGKNNIFYTVKGFEDILPNLWNVYMAFIVEDNNSRKKYVIDSNDYCTIKKDAYDWCDIYGHCNVNFSVYPKDTYPKLKILCPSFGIRCWNFTETIYYCISNLCKLKFRVPSVKKYIWRYWKQYRRMKYEYYMQKSIKGPNLNIIYSCNTLWYNTCIDNDKGLNHVRTLFFDACRETPNIKFERGLVPTNRSKAQIHKFEGYLTPSVNSKVYLHKTKESILVFNTPAIYDCHGWKLGEYMALGKCIITTPIVNELPSPINNVDVENKAWMSNNFYFVEKTKRSMKDAIEFLLNNPEYRNKLASNVRNYWEENGSPISSLKRLGIECPIVK